MVFLSNETGREEIYVQSLAAENPRRELISPAEGTHPVWSRTVKEIFGKATMLFERDFLIVPNRVGRAFDVAADGQRFLMLGAPPERQKARPGQFVVILNWDEELKRQMTGSH